MAKYENIRALAKKQLQAVTESSDRWKAFLRTAAIAYNYNFPNQLLIHEQSPTATAVADIAYWNNNAGRWVKRGAHGIAVFDTRANSSRLRYLFRHRNRCCRGAGKTTASRTCRTGRTK